jgi:biopolymer transport protein TolQ
VDHPFISTLTRSGPVGQTILAGLLILSLYTWTVIFWKRLDLRRAERSARAFLARFRQDAAQWLGSPVGTDVAPPLGPVLAEGVSEYRAQRELAGAGSPLDGHAFARIEEVLEAETTERINELERGQVILAIAASASPFIGLFGTVWGIMNAFRGMSLEGSAGIAAVAPGVAEALVTTVAGLAVAIPAVVAYNIFHRRIQVVTSLLDRFSTEFVRAAHHASARGGSAPSPGAEPDPAIEQPVFARRSV